MPPFQPVVPLVYHGHFEGKHVSSQNKGIHCEVGISLEMLNDPFPFWQLCWQFPKAWHPDKTPTEANEARTIQTD